MLPKLPAPPAPPALSWMVLAALSIAARGAAAGESPVVDAAPNIFGQTGVVRTTSAETGASGAIDVAGSGFAFVQSDFIAPGIKDVDTFVGGYISASAAFLNLVELSLASRAASNSNTGRAPNQFSVGDLYPSVKVGYTLLPVAFGLDVRALLPTSIDAAGYDLGNWALTTQALVTLDLKKGMNIPVRAHLNGGYVFEGGKFSQGAKGRFEDNPNFYDGIDGQLLGLASDQWFYDQVIAGLSVEVPLPYATPFVETWYQGAIGVPGNRGVAGKPYDAINDGHITITPGARVTVGGGLTFDVAVDIGLTGGGAGTTDPKKLVDGTPLNPAWAVRGGMTYTFEPFSSSSSGGGGGGGGAGPTGQLKGCVADGAGHPIKDAVITGEALGGARLATDEAGCFLTPALPRGDIELVVDKSGFERMNVAAAIETGKVVETSVKLKGGAPVVVSSGGVARIIGYVTNKEDETVEADLELWDTSGVKAAGKAVGGAFDLQSASGTVVVVAKADGYLAQGSALNIAPGARGRAAIVLKKAAKTRKAVLEGTKISLNSKVPFEFKKPRLQSTAEYVLDDVVDVMLRNPSLKLRIDVYTEALGTADENQRLADDRAATVVDYLANHGVWSPRLSARGIPLAANEKDSARRVEFIVQP